MVQPVAQPMVQPMDQAVVQPMGQPMGQPMAQPMAQPQIDGIQQSMVMTGVQTQVIYGVVAVPQEQHKSSRQLRIENWYCIFN